MRSANALLGILFGIMLLCAGGAWWFWRHGGAFDCRDKLIGEAPSPDGKYVAARWERACGDAVATHVSLRARGAPFSTAEDDDVYVAQGRARMNVRWSGPRGLTIGTRARSAIPDKGSWHDVRLQISVDALPRCNTDADCPAGERCVGEFCSP